MDGTAVFDRYEPALLNKEYAEYIGHFFLEFFY